MEESADVFCPFCGQTCTFTIDTSMQSQQFTTDCEICCRPFRISVECEDREILSIDAQSE